MSKEANKTIFMGADFEVELEELQRRNFSPTTIRSYLHAVDRFARHFKCRPDRLNQTHLRSHQAHLLRTGQLQPKTVRLHVSALWFFFVKTWRRRYLLDGTPYPKARRFPQTRQSPSDSPFPTRPISSNVARTCARFSYYWGT